MKDDHREAESFSKTFITHLLQKNITLLRFLWNCMNIGSNSVMQIMYEEVIECSLLWTRFDTPSTIAGENSTIQRILQAWSRGLAVKFGSKAIWVGPKRCGNLPGGYTDKNLLSFLEIMDSCIFQAAEERSHPACFSD